MHCRRVVQGYEQSTLMHIQHGIEDIAKEQLKQKSYVKRDPYHVDGIDINRASCFPSLDVDQ